MRATLKNGLMLSILLLLLSTNSAIASQPPKSLTLQPNAGIELTTVVGYIRTYRDCMDNVQAQFVQNANDHSNNARIGFNSAKKGQCKDAHEQLKQAVLT